MRRLIPAFLVMALAVLLASAAPVAAQEAPEPPLPVEAEEPAPAEGEGQITIMQVIQWGGAVGYFIIFLSFVTVVLVIAHVGALRRSRLLPQQAIDKLAKLLGEQKVEEAVDYSTQEASLISRVIAGGLSRHGHPYEEMEQVMSDVAEDEAMRLEQGVGYFSLLAAIAPLLGLLGTVIGMIAAFNQIAVRGVTTPGELADPIQRALVTTCFGLIVAIPNVVAFTFFRNKLRRLMADLSVLVDEFMMPFRSIVEHAAPAPAYAAAPAGATLAPEAEDDAPMLTLKTLPPSEAATAFEEEQAAPTPFDAQEGPGAGLEEAGEEIEESQPVAEAEEAEEPSAGGEEAEDEGEEAGAESEGEEPEADEDGEEEGKPKE